MEKNSCRLILGSASPRRKELLKWLYIPFEVIPSRVPEISEASDPENYVLDLAKLKARDVFSKQDPIGFPIVIGSDTVVANQGRILEKPKDFEDAKTMLKSLSGKSHQVFTAVSFVWPGGERSFAEKTIVEFDDIDEEGLELYLKSGESMDKAGAYGIQGAALAFIKGLEGSYSNVVGLPLNRVRNELESIVKSVFGEKGKLGEGKWRDYFENI